MSGDDDHEGRIQRLEERLNMTDGAVEATQNALTALGAAFTDYTTATNQTIADILAREANGATITGSELAPITDGLNTLTAAVESATASVKGEDPGPLLTTEGVSVSIDASGEGSAQIEHAFSLVSITQQPESGTATLSEVAESSPPATKVSVANATPETTQTVVVSIAQ